MKTLKRLAIFVLLQAVQSGGASGQTLTSLYSFNYTDGGNPWAGLVQGSDGNFYGTTPFGGGSTNCSFGCGTVFRISSSGSFTNLYSFSGGSDEGSPLAGLVQGSDGNFYGTTSGNWAPHGGGTVFRISPSGSFTNLYTFSSSDGWYPTASLVQGSDGNFYGTTEVGGANDFGTVFRICPSGGFVNLHSFNYTDGGNPRAGLVQGSDGKFYGTTMFNGANGYGTIFRISSSGNFTNLHSFSGSDGSFPEGGLVQGSDGSFYGTTYYGGVNDLGTVFRISPSGSFTNLYLFSGSSDGYHLLAGLVQGSDGNFYGTTIEGGAHGNGTVFRISPSGSLTNLCSFDASSDGDYPSAGLVQGSDGNFYGTTYYGGTSGSGTVFRLSISLNPPPNQISEIQLLGTNVMLTIPSVAGETYQLQFSSSMDPTNWVNVPSASVTNSIGAMLTLTNFGGALSPQGFYRFSITP